VACIDQLEIELSIVCVRVDLVPLVDGFDVDGADLVVSSAQIR